MSHRNTRGSNDAADASKAAKVAAHLAKFGPDGLAPNLLDPAISQLREFWLNHCREKGILPDSDVWGAIKFEVKQDVYKLFGVRKWREVYAEGHLNLQISAVGTDEIQQLADDSMAYIEAALVELAQVV